MVGIWGGCTAFEGGRVKDKVEDGGGKGRESARLVEREEGPRFSCKLSTPWLGWGQIGFEDIKPGNDFSSARQIFFDRARRCIWSAMRSFEAPILPSFSH